MFWFLLEALWIVLTILGISSGNIILGFVGLFLTCFWLFCLPFYLFALHA